MNPKFIPLTRHEMFFGITTKINLSAGGPINSAATISEVASTPINVSYVSPSPNISINTSLIAQQQIGFVLSDFLWKYKLEIGLVIATGLIIYYSTKENEDEKGLIR